MGRDVIPSCEHWLLSAWAGYPRAWISAPPGEMHMAKRSWSPAGSNKVRTCTLSLRRIIQTHLVSAQELPWKFTRTVFPSLDLFLREAECKPTPKTAAHAPRGPFGARDHWPRPLPVYRPVSHSQTALRSSLLVLWLFCSLQNNLPLHGSLPLLPHKYLEHKLETEC